jgi:hypothetical protein
MELKIDNIDYRFLNNAVISEQAGSTAVMEVNIKLDGKREPQPFDTVEITQEAKEFGGDVLENGGIKDDVEIIDGTLKLKKTDDTPIGVFNGLILGDLT